MKKHMFLFVYELGCVLMLLGMGLMFAAIVWDNDVLGTTGAMSFFGSIVPMCVGAVGEASFEGRINMRDERSGL